MPDSIKKAFNVIQNPSAYTLAERLKAHDLIDQYYRYTARGTILLERVTTVIDRNGEPTVNHKTTCTPDVNAQQVMQAERYFNESGDVGYLCGLLSRDIELTKDTRLFIASVLAGFIKPKNKKKREYFRDERIFYHIKLLIQKGANLTGNKDTEGAALQVSKQFGITEEAALKIYERRKPKPKKVNLDDYL